LWGVCALDLSSYLPGPFASLFLALIHDMTAMFANLTLQECEARFDITDCCGNPVLDLAKAVAAPYQRDRGLVRQTSKGELQALLPALIDGEPPALRQPLGVAGVVQWECESGQE
jgi:crotonobetainyl-CoA:carnitine CoA-transferase CaiB-like acyl-CoA transferase